MVLHHLRPLHVIVLLILCAVQTAMADSAVPLCDPNQLAGNYGTEGAAGHFYSTVTISNKSKSACLLEGAPKIKQLDETGQLMMPKVIWPVNVGGSGEGARSLALKPCESLVRGENREQYV
jgi:hypothetical protein